MLPTAQELAATLAPLERARPLPARAYTSEDVLAWEVEHLFLDGWIAVARAGELPRPGAFVTRAVGSESLLVVRGEDGMLRAFFNVCQHRGSRLVTADSGSASRLTCPYHAWSYALDGRLVHAGWMDLPEGVTLGAVRCAQESGLAWVDASGAAPSLRDRLSVPLAFAGRHALDRLECVHRVSYDVAANWKVVCENYSECYHCPGVHPELNTLSPARGAGPIGAGADTDGYGERWCGGHMRLADGIETLASGGGGAAGRAPLPGLAAPDRRRVNYFLLFPNCFLALHPDYALTFLLWPRAAGRTEVVCEWLFAPEDVAAPGFDPSGPIEFWDRVNREDWRVCALTQLGMASRGFAGGRYSPQEGDSHAFARIVARSYLQLRG